MKSKLRASFLVVLGLAGLGIVSNLLMPKTAGAVGASGYTTIKDTYTARGVFAVRLASGETSCGGNGFWGFNNTTSDGRAMMATLLTAHAVGNEVRLICDGPFQSWSKITAIYHR